MVRERLQALEIINERFARQFRMGLFNLLRRSPDITVGAIRIQPYHEFARNLPVPTNLNLIHLKPLRLRVWWCSRQVWCLSPSITCLGRRTLPDESRGSRVYSYRTARHQPHAETGAGRL